MLTEHKEFCLKTNGAQTVKLKIETIEFNFFLRQLAVPFKIIADFECNLEKVESNETKNQSYSKKCQDHISCSFSYKLLCVDKEFNKRIVVYRGENAAYEFIKAILKEDEYCKKVMKKHFNKKLIIFKKKNNNFN